MLKDQTSPYYAQIDPEGGQILNAQTLGFQTAWHRHGRQRPPDHRPPTRLRLAQRRHAHRAPRRRKRTVGYAERAYSLINRYQFNTGIMKGVVVGLSTSYQQNYRADT